MTDPATLPRTTPTALAEAVYRAGRDRRHRDTNGMPDPRRAWKPEADPDVLYAITRRAFEARIDELLSADLRAKIADALDADLARRFPADEMIVLDRWGFARRIDTAIVAVSLGRGLHFPLRAPRTVPVGQGGTGSAHRFTARADDIDGLAAAPVGVLPALLPVVDAYALRAEQFDSARTVPATLRHKLKRQPVWMEIEAECPHVAAWMAKMRRA